MAAAPSSWTWPTTRLTAYVHLPPDTANSSRYSALFLVHGGDGRCSLMNAFSGAMTPLPELAALLLLNPHYAIRKVVLDDSSSHPLIAVMEAIIAMHIKL